jgi:anaerobic magnesium-protoporphyrin IX monomethyl ester cyclase
MRVLFCIADNKGVDKIKSEAFGKYPPLGAGYMASMLLQKGHQVKILDNSVENLSNEEFLKYLKEFKPEIVCFTTYTLSIEESFRLAHIVKKENNEIKVILGGPHASYLPESTLLNKNVDMVVIGEGEYTLTDIVTAVSLDKPLFGIKGLFYKENNKIIKNPPRELISDLDSLPFPAYELMRLNKYYASESRKVTNRIFVSIITSRGCPYKCTFCSNKMFGAKIRFRSPENIISELLYLKNNFKIGEFVFVDDVFTIDQRRAKIICESIRSKKLDIVWTCSGRVGNSSEEIYKELAAAGCKGICLGVESSSQEVLDQMNKNTNINQIEKSVKLAKKYIENVICTFIFGMPGDNLERAYETIKFAKRLNPDHARFYIATPYPGSALFDRALKDGLIRADTLSWSDCFETFSARGPIMLSQITPAQLIRLFKLAHREFYLRIEYIISRVKKSRSIKDLIRYTAGLLRIIFYQRLNWRDS